MKKGSGTPCGTTPLELATPSNNASVGNLIDIENIENKSELKVIKSGIVESNKILSGAPQELLVVPVPENIEKEVLPVQVQKVQKSRLVSQGSIEEEILVTPKRVGTRSQPNLEHGALTFGKKVRKMTSERKMSGMKWEEARNYIPICKDEGDVDTFIAACEIAIRVVDPEHEKYITDYIVTRMVGDIHKVIKNKDVSTWKNIKGYLKEAYEDQYMASALQVELNNVQMRYGERVIDYSRKVEGLFFKLSSIVAIDKSEYDAKILRDALREQTLLAYIRGLLEPIKTHVKARNPTTFEQAKQIALSEEMESRTERERFNFQLNRNNTNNYNRNENQRYPPRNNINNNNNYNHNNRNNNQPNYLRTNNTNFNQEPNRRNNFNNYNRRNNNNFGPPNGNFNNRPPTNNNYSNRNNSNLFRPPNNTNNYGNQRNNNVNNSYTRPPTNYNNNNRGINCTYCKKIGHKAEECYKKLNDDRRNQVQPVNYNSSYDELNRQANNNSGNGIGSDDTSGVRSIGQVTAEISEDVSTLSLH